MHDVYLRLVGSPTLVRRAKVTLLNACHPNLLRSNTPTMTPRRRAHTLNKIVGHSGARQCSAVMSRNPNSIEEDAVARGWRRRRNDVYRRRTPDDLATALERDRACC